MSGKEDEKKKDPFNLKGEIANFEIKIDTTEWHKVYERMMSSSRFDLNQQVVTREQVYAAFGVETTFGEPPKPQRHAVLGDGPGHGEVVSFDEPFTDRFYVPIERDLTQEFLRYRHEQPNLQVSPYDDLTQLAVYRLERRWKMESFRPTGFLVSQPALIQEVAFYLYQGKTG